MGGASAFFYLRTAIGPKGRWPFGGWVSSRGSGRANQVNYARESKRITPMYRDIPSELLQLVEPVVHEHGLELVDASIRQGRGRAQVRLVIDTPRGDGRVLVDQCARVSREVEHGLDAVDLIPGAYLLEVTSPGIDRVLGREVDFERAVGRKVAIETRNPVGRRRRFRGELIAFDARGAHVETSAGPFDIPFEAISKATAYSSDLREKSQG